MERIKSPKTINENSLVELQCSIEINCGNGLCKCVRHDDPVRKNELQQRRVNTKKTTITDNVEEDQVETHRYQMVYMRANVNS